MGIAINHEENAQPFEINEEFIKTVLDKSEAFSFVVAETVFLAVMSSTQYDSSIIKHIFEDLYARIQNEANCPINFRNFVSEIHDVMVSNETMDDIINKSWRVILSPLDPTDEQLEEIMTTYLNDDNLSIDGYINKTKEIMQRFVIFFSSIY